MEEVFNILQDMKEEKDNNENKLFEEFKSLFSHIDNSQTKFDELTKEAMVKACVEFTILFANNQCKEVNKLLLAELDKLKSDFHHREKKYKEQLKILNSFLEKRGSLNPCKEIELPQSLNEPSRPKPHPATQSVAQFMQSELNALKTRVKEMEEEKRRKKNTEYKSNNMDWDDFNDIMEIMDNK